MMKIKICTLIIFRNTGNQLITFQVIRSRERNMYPNFLIKNFKQKPKIKTSKQTTLVQVNQWNFYF